MKISKYFQFKPQEIKAAIQIKDGRLRLAALKCNKNERILFLTEIKAPFRSIEAFSQPLKTVFLVIPRHLTIARFLNLPATEEKEIVNMVGIESLRQMPYRLEDTIIGYRVIEKQDNGYSTVLSAAAETSQIKVFLDILAKAGIEPEKITISSEALFCWYQALPENLKSTDVHTKALINIDLDYIDIVILENEKIRFTRGFSYNGELKEKLAEAAEEIKKSFSTYQRQANQHINKIIVTGAQDAIAPILGRLQPGLDITPQLIRQDEVKALIQNPKPDFSRASFAGLLGLVLKNHQARINLLPQELAQSRQKKALKKDLSKVSFLLFLAAGIFVLIIAKQFWDKHAYLRLLNLKLESIAPQVAKAKAMRENIKVIRSQIEQRPLAIEVFTEVYKAAPVQIRLNLVDYKSAEFLLIKGIAGSLDEVISFVGSLNESDYFKNVRIRYTAQRDSKASSGVDFELAAELALKP